MLDFHFCIKSSQRNLDLTRQATSLLGLAIRSVLAEVVERQIVLLNVWWDKTSTRQIKMIDK